MWDARVVKVERDPYIMCFSYKWLGESDVHVVAQPDFYMYEQDPYDDSMVVDRLWDLMDEAEIVVAHNARKFDNRVATARFIANNLTPPSPYKTVDTLQAARRYFRFGSNSLQDLCAKFHIGSKAEQTHGKLWHKCLEGDMEAWEQMKHYCKQDTLLLEGLYYHLRPYISNHPSVTVDVAEEGCPKCGSKSLQYRGYSHTTVSSYRRFQCNDCGGWGRERVAEKAHPKHTNA
jgi:hypothetical protein